MDVPIDESQHIGQGLDDMTYFANFGGLNKNGHSSFESSLGYGMPDLGDSNGAGPAREHQECVVCTNTLTNDNANTEHFSHCGHHQLLCTNCATRLDECPMCRSIKPGREAAVAAAAAQFAALGISDGTQCSVGAGAAVLVEGDGGDQSSVDSSEDASTSGVEMNSTRTDLGIELDTLWGNNVQLESRNRQPYIQPESTDFMTLFENSQWNTDISDQALPQRTPSLGTQIRELDRLMASGVALAASNTSVPLTPLTPMPQLGDLLETNMMLVDKDDAIDGLRPSAADECSELKDSHGKDYISRRENPFAKHNITDIEVSDCTFNEFAQLMRRLKFTEPEQQEGKKFRKRLKNRKQVMSYSARKRNVSKSMGARISNLEAEIKRFRTANDMLQAKNDMLTKKIEEHGVARVRAEQEVRELRMHVESLKALLAQRTQ